MQSPKPGKPATRPPALRRVYRTAHALRILQHQLPPSHPLHKAIANRLGPLPSHLRERAQAMGLTGDSGQPADSPDPELHHDQEPPEAGPSGLNLEN